MKLHTAIRKYVKAKQSVGYLFLADDRMLRSFARSVGNIRLGQVTASMCEAFYRKKHEQDQMPARKHQCLRCFFDFAVSRNFIGKNPLPSAPPKPKSLFRPYIYSRGEIRKLLDAAEDACSSQSIVHGKTFRALLLLQYAAGLRSGEIQNLRRCDVDLRKRLLTIWDTKFFKSRLVPIGRDTAAMLKRYLEEMTDIQKRVPEDGPFFASSKGAPFIHDILEKRFRRACRIAGLQKPQKDPLDLRRHDLRHTFAVHTLIAWYRKGANVQVLLPRLSTYMGHVDLRSTQTYLTMTHELLSEASDRFERYAMASGGQS